MHLFAKHKGSLLPVNDEAKDWFSKVGNGEVVRGKFVRPRNLMMHRKFFALVNLCFDYWEPGELTDYRLEGMTPEKNLERFRKDLTILAGFYEAHYSIQGDVKIEAKSISFANMDQAEFDKLYDAFIDAARKHILPNFTDADVRNSVDEMILSFAA